MQLGQALQGPTFRRFFAAKMTMITGDAVLLLALTWASLAADGSGATLGWMWAAFMAAQALFALGGGLIVDRFSRRHILMFSALAEATVAATIAVIAAVGALSTGVIIVAALAFGAAQAVVMPAVAALLPETVFEPDIRSATSLYQVARQGAFVVGPVIAGLLLRTTPGVVATFAFVTVMFAAAAVQLLALPKLPRQTPLEVAQALSWRQAHEALGYVRRRPWLWGTILTFGVFNALVAAPRLVVMPLLVELVTQNGAALLGIVVATHAAGASVGIALAGVWMPTRGRGQWAYGVTAFAAVALAAASLSTHVFGLMLSMFAAGTGVAAFGLMWETTLTETIQPGYRGRVVSLDIIGSLAPLPFAAPLVGLMAVTWGPRVALALPALAGAAALVMIIVLRPATHRFPLEPPIGPARPPEID